MTLRDRIRDYYENYGRRTLNRFGMFLLSFTITLVLFIVLASVINSQVGSTNVYDYGAIEFTMSIDPSKYIPFGSNEPLSTLESQKRVFMDGHSHTIRSDGTMTPQQLLNWAIACGYNAICVTDHNTIEGGLEAERISQQEPYKDKILVIPGVEYSCCRIHMNILNIREDIPLCGPSSGHCPKPTDAQLKWLIDWAHSKNGLVIVNHMQWSLKMEPYRNEQTLPNHPSFEDLVSWGVDGFEIMNGNIFDWPTYQKASQLNLLMITGSDIHYPSSAYAYTTFLVDEINLNSVIEGFRSKQSQFIMEPEGTFIPAQAYPPRKTSFDLLLPFTLLSNYFKELVVNPNQGMWSFQDSFCHPMILEIHYVALIAFIFYVLIFLLLIMLFGAAMERLFSYIGKCRSSKSEDAKPEDSI